MLYFERGSYMLTEITTHGKIIFSIFKIFEVYGPTSLLINSFFRNFFDYIVEWHVLQDISENFKC